MSQTKKTAPEAAGKERAAKPEKVMYKGREVDPSVNHPRPRWGKTAKDRAARTRSYEAPVAAAPAAKGNAKKR